MIRVQYQRGAQPVQTPAAAVVPDQPHIQAQLPVRRMARSVALLTTIAFVPLSAGPAVADGAAQGGAGIVRRATVHQYQAIAAPVVVTDTLTAKQVPWEPQYPDQIARQARRPHLRPSTTANPLLSSLFESPSYNPATQNGWMRPASEPVRRRGVHPSRMQVVATPVGLGFGHVSWSFPDDVPARRWLITARQQAAIVAPVLVPDATEQVTPLSWAPSYPARIYRPMVPVSVQPTLAAPVFVPDVTQPVAPLSWLVHFPDRLDARPGLRAAAQQALAWSTETPVVAVPDIDYWAVFPDRVYGKPYPLSARQFELVAPVFVPEVTEGSAPVGWWPSAPDIVRALRARPDLMPALVVPLDVVPELATPVYPDRIYGRARLVEFPSVVAPLFVADVTVPAPDLSTWLGNAEMPVWRVRRVPGQGLVFVGPVAPVGKGSDTVAEEFFVVKAQGRWFFVKLKGRWFVVEE